MIGHNANSEISHGAITRGARLSLLQGGTELFLQSDQGATEKELNSPQTRPIGLILALRCEQRVRLGHRMPPSVRNWLGPSFLTRPRSSRAGTFLDFHQTAFDDRRRHSFLNPLLTSLCWTGIPLTCASCTTLSEKRATADSGIWYDDPSKSI